MTTQFASGNGAALPEGRHPTVAAYMDAMKALNFAAHKAVRASYDTTLLPHIDRQSLRLICAETDRLVDDGERSAHTDSRITAARLDTRA
jgi:hypothetical protein